MNYNLTLTLDQINAILTLLSEHPFKVSAPLIESIRAQIIPQTQVSSNAVG